MTCGSFGELNAVGRSQKMARLLLCVQSCAVGSSAIAPLAFMPAVYAQLTPDNTLGAESSDVFIDVSEDAELTIQIGGGAERGNVLFHSFDEFNVPMGQRVFFTNPANTFYILNRVTGDRPSTIDGTLGVDGFADLFFLNPNGIIFGDNAQLDVNGSAVFSSADSFLLGNNKTFGVGETQLAPLLNVSAPIGLQYGRNAGAVEVLGPGNGLRFDTQNGGIQVVRENLSQGLQVPFGRTLALIGNGVTVAGGTLRAAEFGRIELGSVGDGSTVGVNGTALGLQLNYDAVENFSDIQLTRTAVVDAALNSELQIAGRAVTLDEGAAITTSTAGFEPGGSFRIFASDRLQLTGNPASETTNAFIGGIFSQSDSDPVTALSSLNIETERLIVEDGARIVTSSFELARGRQLAIRASESVILENASSNDFRSAILTETIRGVAGDIDIETGQLLLSDGSVVGSTISVGNEPGSMNDFFLTGGSRSGNITIRADEVVDIDGFNSLRADPTFLQPADTFLPSSIFSRTLGDSQGGNVEIETREFSAEFFGSVRATTAGSGDSGNIRIDAQAVNLIAAGLLDARTTAEGMGGRIEINASQVNLQTAAAITVDTRGDGDSGEISINADRIESSLLGFVAATTNGAGDGGNIELNAREGITFDNTFVETTSLQDATGDGGSVLISAGSLSLMNVSEIASESLGEGAAGELVIAADSVRLSDSVIDTRSQNGSGGLIDIDARELLILRDGSEITSTAGTAMTGGNGGNISIDAGFLLAVPQENSDISANAFEGDGGQVLINTQGVVGIDRRDAPTALSDITASSELGQSGVVNINTPPTEPDEATVELPDNFVDASDQVGQSLCSGDGNAFTASGRGGLPTSPYGVLDAAAPWEDWYIAPEVGVEFEPEGDRRSNTVSGSVSEVSEVSVSESLVEAQGWTTDSTGSVVLTVTPAVLSTEVAEKRANCQRLRESLGGL